MKNLARIILGGAFCLSAVACEPNPNIDAETDELEKQGSSGQEEQGSESRSAASLASRFFEERKSACGFLVGKCLQGTQHCLKQDDDNRCELGFNKCRDNYFAKACDTDEEIRIGLGSALQCWSEFHDCAQSEENGQECVDSLSDCIATGSACELEPKLECDRQPCSTAGCEAMRWPGSGWPGSKGWPGGSGGWPGGSGGSGGWPGGSGGWPGGSGGWPGGSGGWPGGSGGWPGFRP